MASLTAPIVAPSHAGVRPTRQNSKVSVGSISSLRIKPFTSGARGLLNSRQQQSSLRVKAAEVASAGDDLDFEFNYNDAKKNNDYNPSDVEAALKFYSEGTGVEPAADQEFISNLFGVEDASFFDDIDNNEAYEADEYIAAGIPEAAPKKRGRGRRDGGGEEELDDVEQAKLLDKIKDIEDAKLVEAALEEEFGDSLSAKSMAADADGAKSGVWDWLSDFSSDTAADEVDSSRSTSTKLPSDAEVLAEFGNVNLDELDPEIRDMLDLIVAGDDLSERELELLAKPDNQEVPESVITDEILTKIGAAAGQVVPTLELEVDASIRVPPMDNEPELDQQVVDDYVATLKAAAAKKVSVDMATVKAMFGDEPLELEAADGAEADPEIDAILAAPEPALPNSEEINIDSELAELSQNAEDDMLIDDSLESDLRYMAELTDEDFELQLPSEEQMEALKKHIAVAEEFLSQEDARQAEMARAVASGELTADSMAESLENEPDVDAEILAEKLLEDDDMDGPAMVDDEDDGEQWMERIIELTRVTKVVKGGKIMGFRCVAIVGNQNGLVGVGCQAGREIAVAVKRTLVDAKKNVVRVPLVGPNTIPHRAEAKYHAARCVVVPASEGTGCIAGGSIRSVLELAGVQNCLAKRIGCRSALNNARATVKALQSLQTLYEVSEFRGVPMDQLLLPKN